MTTEHIIRCDVCGKLKGQVNHWWRVWIGTDCVLRIAAHDKSGADDYKKDACGHQCVTQFVARFLDHGTLEEKANETRQPDRA